MSTTILIEKIRESVHLSRSEYFSALDALHSNLFSPSETCFDTDIFLREAEKVFKGEGRFKYYFPARYRLNALAKDYIKKFTQFDPYVPIAEIAEKIAGLENAHFKFADQFAKESKGLKKFQRIFILIGFQH